MHADDIPTEITKLTYSRVQALGEAGLPVLSQNQTAEFLAHYWPATEAHIREQVAQESGGAMARPELVNWAEQLQSADLTPHPAWAWCSTTTGYEVAAQVATTDALTAPARERLLTELQVAFDETVRRVLGYSRVEIGAGQ